MDLRRPQPGPDHDGGSARVGEELHPRHDVVRLHRRTRESDPRRRPARQRHSPHILASVGNDHNLHGSAGQDHEVRIRRRLTTGQDHRPIGSLHAEHYDLAGRLTQVANYSSAGARLATTDYAYDAAGNQVAITSPNGAVSNVRYSTTFTYDALNRLQAVSQPLTPTTSADASYHYDTAGNLAATDPDGNTTTYTYTPWNLRQDTIEPATRQQPSLADRTFTHLSSAGRRRSAATRTGRSHGRSELRSARATDSSGRCRSRGDQRLAPAPWVTTSAGTSHP